MPGRLHKIASRATAFDRDGELRLGVLEPAATLLPNNQVPRARGLSPFLEKAAEVHQITTVDEKGREHTRPFSLVSKVVGSEPPTVGVSMLKPGGRTLDNAKATEQMMIDHKPYRVSKVQEADVVFATEKKAFVDELRKIAGLKKEAIDPLTVAGITVAGKIGLSNFLTRHGTKLPPIRRLVQEIMGVGYRTARQGRPMLSRPTREALALGLDANLMNAYEMAHGAGSSLAPNFIRRAPELLAQTGMVPKPYVKLLSGIPTESTGLRKVVDYGFSPVGQVGHDIAGVAKDVGSGISNRVGSIVNKLRRTKTPPAGGV